MVRAATRCSTEVEVGVWNVSTASAMVVRLLVGQGRTCRSAVPPCFSAEAEHLRGTCRLTDTSAADNGWQTRHRLLGARTRFGMRLGRDLHLALGTRLSPRGGLSGASNAEVALSPSTPRISLSAGPSDCNSYPQSFCMR